jgi:hypothetical protein
MFNTVGVCIPSEHYMLPVLPRIPDIDDMVEEEFYFILHAPRQSGKTTFLQALTEKINSQGIYCALNCSLASLKNNHDKNDAISEICSQINLSVKNSQVVALKKQAYAYDSLPGLTSTTKVRLLLNSLSRGLNDKELIVFFDEADCLAPEALIPFLAQIRDGYLERHLSDETKFPRSMALVGMRDIRDYLVQVRPEEQSIGLASPFNVKKESLTLANFTRDEIQTLYGQHTESTGQKFTSEAIDRAWHWTEGQPWLVNALAYEVVVKQLKNDFSIAITGNHIDQAAETLIQRRDTHIDSLLERLKEPKVIKVMDAVFAGTKGKVPVNSDDRQYCIDLGLVFKNNDQSLRPSNKIYQEVFSRVITDQIQYVIDLNQDRKIWTDGKVLFMSNLLKEFQIFWRHDSRSFPFRYKDFAAFKYDEATYTFMLLAYMQKVVNSGGKVHRQFAEGRGDIDIIAIFNSLEYLIEVKLKEDYFSMEDSLKQLAGYMDTSGEKEGWLVVFDRDLDKSWEEKIYWDTKQMGRFTIHVVGC